MKTPIRARREEEKERRRRSILDAAEKVIARRGLEKANFGEIARRTRLSRSLIYVYFPSKEDLFHAVCERGLHRLAEAFGAAAAAHTAGLDQVMAMGEAYRTFAEQEPLYFELLAELQTREDTSRPATASEASVQTHGRSCLTLVAEALVRGLRDGTVRPGIGDPGATAVSVWAFTHGLIQVSRKKATMLEEEFHLGREEMIRHGFALMRGSLAASA
jgi:AcrR family transcriptional regulator